MHLKKEN